MRAVRVPLREPVFRFAPKGARELRHAIEHNQLELHYQPKVCLRTGQITGAEALVRWRDPEEGLLYPNDFIPLAEQSGLIVPLGEWVVETACSDAGKAWRKGVGAVVPVSVNMSATQLRQRPAALLQAALKRHGLPAKLLEVELTESTIVTDIHAATESLLEIGTLGVRVALDDFGVGYSNLSLLGRMPVDVLKVDRSLVMGIAISPRDGVIAGAVIDMAHALGMRVVAEGVETRAQLQALQRASCDEIQGYLIAEPVGAATFNSWVRNWQGQVFAANASLANS
ncbi:MAG TPA: EAL domain-containing protein [Steroidobacteraceae bacterium]|nr:EAL domain-containing protein [Steroidobacteraceae bacterium]